ncbi:MAG: YicC family protein [Candidatus Acetothermia bacterium]|nr:YicC family protein [Candidatus Acetothermia bacterium]
MIRSMTGFGRGSASSGAWMVEARLKTVNHRYLELQLRGLEGRETLEIAARRLLEGAFARGRIELAVELESAGEGGLIFDLETARRYYRSLNGLCNELGLEDWVRLSDLIALGALRPQEDEEELWLLLERAINEAIASVQEMRAREGEHLQRDLEGALGRLSQILDQVEARAPEVKVYYREKLRERVEELLQSPIVRERLEEEVVLFVERADISEELVRLRSHLAGARAAFDSPEPAGRVLDFLAQEMAREANTIAAKARDTEILRQTVAMRAEIERLREQVRNIE